MDILYPKFIHVYVQSHLSFQSSRAMADPAMSAPFVVASEDSLNRFEAPFVDEHTNDRYTVSFFVREPVLYHPAHQAKPSFTHISYISKGYFVVGASTTDRMIPIRRTQQVLFKLSPDDIEREIEGNQLDPGERCIWRRWADADALRRNRKSRIRAPCCGRFACPYQLVQDGDGLLRCNKCRTEPWPAWSVSKQLEQPMPQLAQGTQLVEPTPEVAPWQQAQPMPQFKQEKQDSGAAMPTPRLTAMGVVPNPNEAPADKPVLPPWRKRKADGEEIAPPPKSMRKSNGGLETWHAHENREEGLHAALLGQGQLEQTPVQGTEPSTQAPVGARPDITALHKTYEAKLAEVLTKLAAWHPEKNTEDNRQLLVSQLTAQYHAEYNRMCVA